jgi:hypothetical protein
MLAADNEPGAEVYSAATTRDQARIVFHDAQGMAQRTPEFRRAYSVQAGAHNIHQIETGSKFEPLSADVDTLDGRNIHLAVYRRTARPQDTRRLGRARNGDRGTPAAARLDDYDGRQRPQRHLLRAADLCDQASGSRHRRRELFRDHLHDRRGRRLD